MKLKLDQYVKRKYSPKIKEQPKSPLTQKQKDFLKLECWDKCKRAYIKRFTSSALMSNFDETSDLVGEAFVAMHEILERFDVGRCGKVEDKDTQGADQPKTLKFYFLNYFYGRVNFMACEARNHKKSHNVVSGEKDGPEIEYNPIDDSATNVSDHAKELADRIKTELKSKSEEFRRFFYQTTMLEYHYKELVEEYSQEKCKRLKGELTEFNNYIYDKYITDYGSPYNKKSQKGRKKKESSSRGNARIKYN